MVNFYQRFLELKYLNLLNTLTDCATLSFTDFMCATKISLLPIMRPKYFVCD